MRLPEFPSDLHWFNCKPLSTSRDLLGKVVVLDFWTFCCINCMHVLPDLARLEERYKDDPVLFIGVHSPKFSHERSPEAVQKAIERLHVHHPVVSDPEMSLWRHLGVRAWPTIAIVGPDGRLAAMVSGEGNSHEIDEWIGRLLPSASGAPQESIVIQGDRSQSLLRFPSKVALDSREEHLCIADSGNHRIVIANRSGSVVDQIGSTRAGFADGPFETCALRSPQGVSCRGHKLYIADTENHAIRLADLQRRTLTTLAGTGRQGYDYKGGGFGREQPLSSPWDVALVGHLLYIAMAGTHQIWVYDIQTDRCSAYSGTGAELHLNSSHARRSCWSQPSGIAVGMGLLFVADSESSAIRQINPVDGSTATIVGGDAMEPRNLFAYGDRDGVGSEARLQHPLALCWWEQRQRLIVADTYNHKLKLVDPLSRSIVSWIGSGRAALDEGVGAEASFSEPSGLALTADGTTLYVADTNNHAIRVIDTATSEVKRVVCGEEAKMR